MLKPKAEIRRFDVFAEYNRLKAMREGMPADEAAGYGLWLAKVVAARKFSRDKTKTKEKLSADREKERERRGKWHLLSDQPQTDALFRQQIVERMGPGFYRQVFTPAIRKALVEGKDYTEIRDAVRKEWKPTPS